MAEMGLVTVYCATATGGITEPDADSVTEALQVWAVPTGVTAVAKSAVPSLLHVVYTAIFTTSSSVLIADREMAIEMALAEFFSREPIGGHRVNPPYLAGKLFVDAIEGVIRSATPGCLTVRVTSPSSDAGLNPNGVVQYAGVTHGITEVME